VATLTRPRLVPWLVWVAGLLAAQVAAGVVLWPWIDPRYSFYGPADAHNHVVRLYFLDSLLGRGILFPRWWPDLALGFGYPLLSYYSPGAYYVAQAWHLAGAGFYRSAQLLGAVSVALGASGAYVLGAWLFRRVPAALVLAFAYVLAPYPFLTNLYGDVTLPQALGLGLLPWLLAFAWRAVERGGAGYVLGLAGALAGLVLTHSITALLGAGMLVPWLAGAVLDVPPGARRAGIGRALTGVGLGLALSAFAWLPAVSELSAVHVELGRLPYLTFERSLWPLPLDPNWMSPRPGGSSEAPRASVSQAVFLAGSVLVGVAGWAASRGARKGGVARGEAVPWGAVGAAGMVAGVTWYLNGTWSRPVWETAPLLANIQFAWRLWGPFSLAVAIFGAGSFAGVASTGRPQWLLAGLLTGLVAVGGLSLRPPAPVPDAPIPESLGAAEVRKDEGSALVAMAGTTSTGEFLPRSVVFDAPLDAFGGSRDAYERRFPGGGWIAGRLWPYAGTVRVRQVWDAPTSTRAEVEASGGEPAEVGFRTLVFPGWRAYVDGRRVQLEMPPVDPVARLGYGFAVVTVPPGAHTVELALGSTPWRTAGAVLAIAGAGAAVALLGWGVASRAVRARLVVVVGVVTLVAVVGKVADDVHALRSPPWSLPMFGRRAPPSIVLDLAGVPPVGGAQRVAREVGDPGGHPGGRVDVGAHEIGGHRRSWLVTNPPAEVAAEVLLPERAVFQSGLGIDPQSPEDWEGPGAVRFTLEVVDDTGGRKVLLDEVVRLQVGPAERGWRFALVDLGAYARRRVTLVLRTEASDAPAGLRAGWADAFVYVDRSARYPPPTFVAPALSGGGR
jgi:hypothetical protein